MLKVIIADDEARVCSLIRMLIDWEALGLELAGIAANGIEALELVETRQPDILITDIRMPGCHGLELIERAKAARPQLEIVIISGYAHFEYAQSAIRFGVSDYLLKPIDQQQLTNTLGKLADRCRSRCQIGSEVENLRKISKEDMLQLQSQLMRDLLSGAMEETTEDVLWRKYRFRAEAGCLQIVLMRIDYDGARISPVSLRIIEEKAAQVLSQELSAACQTLMIHVSGGIGGALIGFGPGDREHVRKRMCSCLNQLCAQGELFGGFEFSMAVSEAITDMEQMAGACSLAHGLLMERLTQGTGKILEKLPAPSDWKQDDLLKPYRQAVSDLLRSRSTDGLCQAIDRLEQELREKKHIRGADAYDLVRSAGYLFLQQPHVVDGKNKYMTFAAAITHIGRLDQLFDALRTTIVRAAEEILSQQHAAETRPIRLARDYVLNHFSEPITLEKVCDEVGFSVSYFSALFKRETGENFVRFLTRTRMEHAKELLAQTSMPVSEICAKVGYSDLKHFTQTFKKEADLSPGQYRKLYG